MLKLTPAEVVSGTHWSLPATFSVVTSATGTTDAATGSVESGRQDRQQRDQRHARSDLREAHGVQTSVGHLEHDRKEVRVEDAAIEERSRRQEHAGSDLARSLEIHGTVAGGQVE